jgi:N-terminal domain of anti-restriction factor ArdC
MTQSTTKREYTESYWKGSLHTAAMVAAQIAARWGEEEVENYDPETNCFTFQTWKIKGYHVKKGEKGLLSTTIVTKAGEEDSGDGGKATTYPKKVYLFYYLQVEKDESKS